MHCWIRHWNIQAHVRIHHIKLSKMENFILCGVEDETVDHFLLLEKSHFYFFLVSFANLTLTGFIPTLVDIPSSLYGRSFFLWPYWKYWCSPDMSSSHFTLPLGNTIWIYVIYVLYAYTNLRFPAQISLFL